MIDVYFIVLEKTLALDLSGSAEPLRIANRVLEKQGHLAKFAIHYIGVQPQVQLSTGMCIHALEPMPNYEQLAQCEQAWVVVLGQEGQLDSSLSHNKQVIRWLADLPIQKAKTEIITVCAGSLLLACAGRLNDHQATTHHSDLEQLSQIDPTTQVMQNCVFVEDGAIASSAGVTTGIDLIVHKIAQTCGDLVACEVAQWLVMPYRRTGKETQFSPLIAQRSHLHPAVHRVQEAVSLNPQFDWDLNALAVIACTSTRNLSRLFKANTQSSPMQYVTQVRLEMAKKALANGVSVTKAAQQVGFSSDMQLRRAWRAFKEEGTPSSHQLDQNS